MTRIDANQQLIAIVRSQIGRLQGADAQSKTRGSSKTLAGDEGGRRSATEAGGLELAARVRSLALDDPDRPGKAFKLYLGLVLIRELGWDSSDDMGLSRLVDEVAVQMEADPALRAAMTKAGNLLLQESQG